MRKPLLVWWYGMVGCFSLAVSIILLCSVILVLKLQCNVGDFFWSYVLGVLNASRPWMSLFLQTWGVLCYNFIENVFYAFGVTVLSFFNVCNSGYNFFHSGSQETCIFHSCIFINLYLSLTGCSNFSTLSSNLVILSCHSSFYLWGFPLNSLFDLFKFHF